MVMQLRANDGAACVQSLINFSRQQHSRYACEGKIEPRPEGGCQEQPERQRTLEPSHARHDVVLAGQQIGAGVAAACVVAGSEVAGMVVGVSARTVAAALIAQASASPAIRAVARRQRHLKRGSSVMCHLSKKM